VAMLSVCGGYQLLGQYYQTADGQRLEGADVLPVWTVAGKQRMMHNLVVALNPQSTIDRKHVATLVGFENHSGQTFLTEGAMPLGRVIKGSGNNGQDGTEGVLFRKAIGTYLHGSCLPKNPHLADWLLGAALRHRYGEFDLSEIDDNLEWQAHALAASLKA
jgi:CobQ-like glutamine amidotransferase family enzyme